MLIIDPPATAGGTDRPRRRLKNHSSSLEAVSTTCGSGWGRLYGFKIIRDIASSSSPRPLPKVVLTALDGASKFIHPAWKRSVPPAVAGGVGFTDSKSFAISHADHRPTRYRRWYRPPSTVP